MIIFGSKRYLSKNSAHSYYIWVQMFNRKISYSACYMCTRPHTAIIEQNINNQVGDVAEW
jgi:hypothetical protein